MRTATRWAKLYPFVVNIAEIIVLICCLIDVSFYDDVNAAFGATLYTSCMMIVFSKKIFKFCKWYRYLLYNDIFISFMFYFDKYIYYIEPAPYVKCLLITTAITLTISTLLYFRYGWFDRE